MIILHDFGMNVKEYLKKFQQGLRDFFPLLPCGQCGRLDTIVNKGFRWRFVLGPDTGGIYLSIPIRMLYCTLCHKTISILPSFCVPRRAHSLLAYETFFFYLFFTQLPLAKIIKKAKGRKANGYYQLAQAWIKSFKNNIINLTAEIRTSIKGFHKRIDYNSCRYSDALPTWWGLQNLAHLSFPAASQQLPLERVQMLLKKRRLGIFGYVT